MASGGDASGLAVLKNASNAANAPEENRHADDSNTISENAQEPLSSFPEQGSNDASVSTEEKEPDISKCKSVEEIPRTVTVKRCKNIDSRFWKRQLVVAKDARRVDILCSRIYLSHRLLDGTTRFKDLHQIVEDAKAKLETEVGPLDGMSSKLVPGIVGRLPVAADVQKLCSLAIERADEWLRSNIQTDTNQIDTLPAACRFRFEDIKASSLVLVLKEAVSSHHHAIKGYKLWYWNSREPPYTGEPAVFPKDQRRILLSNLQPCQEYAFRIISFTGEGELGHSESKCFTKSVEIIHKNTARGAEGCSSTAKRDGKRQDDMSSGFKVRQLGNVFRKGWAEENGYPSAYCKDEIEDSCGQSDSMIPDKDQVARGVSRKLNLNETSVPDLNAEVVMPTECFQNENGCSSGKNALTKSNGCGDSETCAEGHVGEAPAMESRSHSHKQTSDLEHADDSNLVVAPARFFSRRLGQLDDNYEYCVKVIRRLECSGHIEKDFRMKFLTWFSLRSMEQERRVVITFIRTLLDEPSSLAGQLLDSFEEIVASKRPRTGFCTKLWH